MRTTVDHGEFVDEHDDPTDVNFGCSPTWFIEGDTGTKIPDYLDPAVDGELINKSHNTDGPPPVAFWLVGTITQSFGTTLPR